MSEPTGAEALATELSHVLAAGEPVQAVLCAAASAALGWRDPDARLAELIAAPATALATVRGGPSRLLSFAFDDVTIDLTVIVDDAGVTRLVGQVAPIGAMAFEVRHRLGVHRGHADELGRFAAADPPTGPMRVFALPSDVEGALGTGRLRRLINRS